MNNSHFSVLFLTSWYPTTEYPTHGVFIRNHARALSHYCRVIVIYVYSSNELKDVTLEHSEHNNLHEYILAFPKSKIPILKHIIHFIKYAYYYYRLAKLIRKHFNDIRHIQVNVIYPVSLFLPIIQSILRIQSYTILEQWTGYLKEDNTYKGFLRKWITKYTVQKARKIWTLCKYHQQSMIQHQLIGNYDIMPNVVNTDIFQPPKSKTSKSKKTFIHISTLDNRQKNINGILRVFKEIENKGYDYDLTIIGGQNDYLQKAREYAQILNLKNVTFKGIIPQEQLVKYYQSADALIMFSNYETFCVVVYEAISCGTYVISSRVADLEKIMSEKYGKIIEPGNDTQLLQAIIDVIENKVSIHPSDGHQLIEQHFSEKQVGKKLFEYYSST